MSILEKKYPSKLLEESVNAISSLPGIGQRSALRLALHLLRQPRQNIDYFLSSIHNLYYNACYCKECMMLSDSDLCSICSNDKRDKYTICIVEDIEDVMSIENTNQYNGTYHVLGGIISPINGIGPNDITIAQLVTRLDRLTKEVDPSEIEVIFALNSDVDGETTAFFIYRQISRFGVKTSTLARGLGFGDDIEYADELTLGRSLINRQIFKP